MNSRKGAIAAVFGAQRIELFPQFHQSGQRHKEFSRNYSVPFSGYLGRCRSKKAQITAGPFSSLSIGPKIRG